MGTVRAVWLTSAGVGGGNVELQTLDEVAALLQVSPDEMTSLRYGALGVMFMGKSVQFDRDIAPNHSASLILQRIHALPVWPRGDVVCFPDGLPWEIAGEVCA